MIKYEKQGRYGIKIEQVSFEKFGQTDSIEREANTCYLFWTEQNKDLLLSFYSDTKEVQALEFMDFAVHDYVIVQGDSHKAQATLDAVFLQVMLLEFESTTMEEFLEKIVERYFVNCDSIYTIAFAEQNRDRILNMPVYVKKKIPWAYVKTTDILQAGEPFYLKSIENQSRILLEASEDIYIMIGQRGEIYHMNREKFERTYEASEEYLDIFEQMLSYMPEVQKVEEDEFIAIDEIAHLCYPKRTGGIYAIPLERRTKVFNPYNDGQYFLGQEGDYMAIRRDDLQDIYIIQKDIFLESYEEQ